MRAPAPLVAVALAVGACGGTSSSKASRSATTAEPTTTTTAGAGAAVTTSTSTLTSSASTGGTTSGGAKPASTTTTRTAASGLRVVPDPRTRTSANPRYRYDVKVPRLVGLADAAMAARINDEVAGQATAAIDQFVKDSADAPAAGGSQPSGLDGDYEVTLLDPRAYSVKLRLSAYQAGAAHPGTSLYTFTFDLRTGRRVRLADLFRPGSAYLPRLSELSRRQLAATLGPDADADQVEAGTQPTEDNFAAWALRPHELEVTFGEYQVGPYALGTPKVAIPYQSLAALVAPGSLVAGR